MSGPLSAGRQRQRSNGTPGENKVTLGRSGRTLCVTQLLCSQRKAGRSRERRSLQAPAPLRLLLAVLAVYVLLSEQLRRLPRCSQQRHSPAAALSSSPSRRSSQRTEQRQRAQEAQLSLPDSVPRQTELREMPAAQQALRLHVPLHCVGFLQHSSPSRGPVAETLQGALITYGRLSLLSRKAD